MRLPRKQQRTSNLENAVYEHLYYDLGGDIPKLVLSIAEQATQQRLNDSTITDEQIRRIFKLWRDSAILRINACKGLSNIDIKTHQGWTTFLQLSNDPQGWRIYLVCGDLEIRGKYFQPLSFQAFQTWRIEWTKRHTKGLQGHFERLLSYAMEIAESKDLQPLTSAIGDMLSVLSPPRKKELAIYLGRIPLVQDRVLLDLSHSQPLQKKLIANLKQNKILYLTLKKKIEEEQN